MRSLAAERGGIGSRLILGVLLLSTTITLVVTAIQLYADYRRDVAEVAARLNRIGGLYSDSLTEGLWTLDERQLRLQLDGILRLPDIRGVEIREAGTGNVPVVKLSRNPEDSTFAREFPLNYGVQGQNRVIGTFRVEATFAGIYRRLANTALTVLVTQAATIFLISLFILYFFHHLVTRHLSAIAAEVGRHRIKDAPLELHLRRRPSRHEDELQQVVTAFNEMSRNLHSTYHDLAEREAKIRRLVDSNIIGIFIWAIDGKIVEANDAFLRMVGYERASLLSSPLRWTDLTAPEWQVRDAQGVEELKRTGVRQPFEKEYVRKDGSRVPVLAGGALFQERGNEGVAFVLDLTEQKRAEAALRESEEQWKAVFENNPVMYFMVGETGTILSVNPFGAEQLGYTVDELVGHPVTMVFYEPDRGTVQKNAAACFERPGLAMSWELRKVRKNGEMIWVRETARATVINSRLVLLIVCEDITEGKRTAEALAGVQSELAHANRVAALGQLTASIAHEVNQPIAGIVNSGQAALRWLDQHNLDALRQAIERMIRDAKRAGDVVGGVRALVKKESPHSESVDINETIREVIVITHGEVAKNGVSVETQFAEGLPLVQGVRVQLQQVILNLVINAIEAMSGVGEGPRALLIKTTQSDLDFVSIAVQDSGPGLDPEHLNRAFEAFYTTKAEGLGMGLSICRSIVEKHGGKFAVKANVPRGAIFVFTVPTREPVRES